MILFINACARPCSRTLVLAEKAADILTDDTENVDIFAADIKPLDCDSLLKREEYTAKGDFSDSMFDHAKQFAKADGIIVAAPYWDLSFPAMLKCYTEAICVNGITFRYNDKGMPEGLCKAKRLIYVTTAGGYIPNFNYGYNYIKQLCMDFFGINNTVCIKAEGLDIKGADTDEIMRTAQEEMVRTLKKH